MSPNQLSTVIVDNEPAILLRWIQAIPTGTAGNQQISPDELKRQCTEILSNIRRALQQQGTQDTSADLWKETRQLLAGISASRATQGFTPSATARFILSLKQSIFEQARKVLADKPAELATLLWQCTEVIDNLALFTTEAYVKTREELIKRQQESMLELSTPVVKLWDGILALPLIGTLDSSRTQVVMESLLQRVVTDSTEVVIIDITGVPTVDTLVAQHLLKTVTAARLMGTDCIISGIRPQIAQTIVHLGVDLTSVITKASLADAFKIALTRRNLMVTRRRPTQEQRTAAATPAAMS